jgi:limonene-1,2-epoxide hydrolase
MLSPEDVVRQFCAVVSKRDSDLVRPLLADGIVYHNIGMAPTTGIEEVLANLAGQWAMFSGTYEFEIHNLAVDGDRVLTERTDTVGADGSDPFPYPIMGIFVIDNGKIAAWRDYFDSAITTKAKTQDVTQLLPSI